MDCASQALPGSLGTLYMVCALMPDGARFVCAQGTYTHEWHSDHLQGRITDTAMGSSTLALHV